MASYQSPNLKIQGGREKYDEKGVWLAFFPGVAGEEGGEI